MKDVIVVLAVLLAPPPFVLVFSTFEFFHHGRNEKNGSINSPSFDPSSKTNYNNF